MSKCLLAKCLSAKCPGTQRSKQTFPREVATNQAMGCYLENISKTSDEYINVVNRVQSESLR